MSNRSEMLHFRATPEEKAALQIAASELSMELSRYIRERLFTEDWRSPVLVAEESRRFPDGPTTRQKALVRQAEKEGKSVDVQVAAGSAQPVGCETYEQFMERRIAELLGDDASPEAREQAETTAQAEWITRDVSDA